MSGCAVFVTCDPAASERNSADHTAIGVWTVTPENDLLLLEVVRVRFGVDRIVPELLAVCRRWNPGWIALEANGFQVAAASPAWPPFARSATKAKENWSAPPRRSSWPSRANSGCRARRNGSRLVSTNSSASPGTKKGVRTGPDTFFRSRKPVVVQFNMWLGVVRVCGVRLIQLRAPKCLYSIRSKNDGWTTFHGPRTVPAYRLQRQSGQAVVALADSSGQLSTR